MSEIKNNIPAAFERLETELQGWVDDGAKTIREEAERRMRLPKSGETRNGHTASAPGEAPAVKTEDLLKNLIFDPQRLKNSVGSVQIKAAALEKGADITSKKGRKWHLAARPYLVVSAKAMLPTIENKLAAASARAQLKQ